MKHVMLTVAALPFLAAGATMPATAQSNSQPNGATVTVKMTDLRNAKGVVRACMTSDDDRFPKCRSDAAAHRHVVRANGSLEFTFRNVAPGRYAIALLHDENENGKADRAMMMMPTEGFGFSRDAKVRMGPPKFRDAAFDVSAANVRQTIKMRYLL